MEKSIIRQNLQVSRSRADFQHSCEEHSMTPFQFILADHSKEVIFKCVFCVTETQVDTRMLIPIEQIANSDRKTIFPNYPVFEQNLFQEMKKQVEILKMDSYENLIEQIHISFKKMRMIIIESIDELEKQYIQKAYQTEEFEAQFFTLYNTISEKSNLKDILCDPSKTLKEQTIELKTILKEVANNQQQNQNQIRFMLNKLSDFQNEFNQKTIKTQIKSTTELIQSILEQIDLKSEEKVSNKFNFIPSSFKNSHNVQIQRVSRGIEMKFEQKNKQALVFNDAILDNQSGYLVKLEFNRPYGETSEYSQGFGISLIPNEWILPSEKKRNFSATGESGFCSGLNYGAKIVVRGKFLSSEDVRKVTTAIELRWCVSTKQFFISDSNYENINQADPIFFDSKESYRIAILFNFLQETDWVITITEFRTINPNEVNTFY